MNDYTLKPCPFCGGNAKVSFKDYRFCGMNYQGDRKLQYRVQVICNRCWSRGKPIITEPLIDPNPYVTKFYRDIASPHRDKNNEMFESYVRAAVDAWNKRTERSEK